MNKEAEYEFIDTVDDMMWKWYYALQDFNVSATAGPDKDREWAALYKLKQDIFDYLIEQRLPNEE